MIRLKQKLWWTVVTLRWQCNLCFVRSQRLSAKLINKILQGLEGFCVNHVCYSTSIQCFEQRKQETISKKKRRKNSGVMRANSRKYVEVESTNSPPCKYAMPICDMPYRIETELEFRALLGYPKFWHFFGYANFYSVFNCIRAVFSENRIRIESRFTYSKQIGYG